MFGIKRRDKEIANLNEEIAELRKKVKHLNGFKSVRYGSGVLGSCSGYVWGALEQSLNGSSAQEVFSVDNGEYGDKFVIPPAPNVTLTRRMAERLIAECKYLYEKAGEPESPNVGIIASIISEDTNKAKERALEAAGLNKDDAQ